MAAALHGAASTGPVCAGRALGAASCFVLDKFAGLLLSVTCPPCLSARPPGCLQTYDVASGACGYGDLPPAGWPNGGFAAIDPAASPFAVGAQQGCGVCLEVQCTDASACGTNAQPLVVLVTDFCAGCGPGAVYLAPTAYAQAVSSSLGQVAGRFRRVSLAGGCCLPGVQGACHCTQLREIALCACSRLAACC